MQNKYLTAADIKNYLYDPAIIYFVHVLKVPQAVTPKEMRGMREHNEFSETSKRNKIIKDLPLLPKHYGLSLSSDKLGLVTKIDCVAIDSAKGEAYPIQIKHSVKPKVLYRTQKFQVIMEAVLLEEKLGYTVPFGFVKFLRTGDFVKVLVTKKTKDEFFKIVGSIRGIVASEEFPKPTSHRQRRVDSVYRNIL